MWKPCWIQGFPGGISPTEGLKCPTRKVGDFVLFNGKTCNPTPELFNIPLGAAEIPTREKIWIQQCLEADSLNYTWLKQLELSLKEQLQIPHLSKTAPETINFNESTSQIQRFWGYECFWRIYYWTGEKNLHIRKLNKDSHGISCV